MAASTDSTSHIESTGRFLNLFTLPGTGAAVLERMGDGDARSLFATGVRPICKMIHEYVWSPKFDSQIGISQVPSPVSFCFLFKDDKYTIIVATNYWNSCTVMSIGGELFRHIGLLLKNPGAIVANGRDGFFVVDNDEKGSPPSIKAFQIHSITETATATAKVTEIAFVNPWSCRLEVPGIGRFWNPVSLTFARDQLVVASDGYHPPVESVSAWNPETGDFNSILLENPAERYDVMIEGILAIDDRVFVISSVSNRFGYHLRISVLEWRDPAAQATLAHSMEMPYNSSDQLFATFMPLSDNAHESQNWTESGKILIADKYNQIYEFSYHPVACILTFERIIKNIALLNVPLGIAYHQDQIMVLNSGIGKWDAMIPGVYIIPAAAPRPPALASL